MPPARLLNIETSTGVCSVAVSEDGIILSSRESRVDRSHAALLTVLASETMEESGTGYDKLDGVAVSRGPGSYTGLRIGVSVAKGICYMADIPLLAVDTLQIMALRVAKTKKETLYPPGNSGPSPLLCPMIDARRMEVYTALYDSHANPVSKVTAEIIDPLSFKEQLIAQQVLFFGDGSAKCRDILEQPNALFISDIYPSATDMAELSHRAFAENKFEDIAYFEPFYLKDFLATTPKNQLPGI